MSFELLSIATMISDDVFSSYKRHVFAPGAGLWRAPRSSSRFYNRPWVRDTIGYPVLVINDMQSPACLMCFRPECVVIHHSRLVNKNGVWNGGWSCVESADYDDPELLDKLRDANKNSRAVHARTP